MTVTPFAARRKSATSTDALALADPDVAVIVTEPEETAVTTPSLDTVATASSDVVHDTVAPASVVPTASLTVAESWVGSAIDPNVSELSDNSRVAATWRTVTATVPLADPDVAVIVAVPSATEVTRPVEDTTATEAADVAQFTVALAIVTPF